MTEKKERQWRRGMERSGRDLQEAQPDNRQKEVNVGSWQCVARRHWAAHPLSHEKQCCDKGGPHETEKKWTTQAQVSLQF